MRSQAAMILLMLSALATCLVAQPGQGLPPPGRAEGFVPGNVDDVRAIGRLISEAARNKFREPTDSDAVVDGEYLVTFNLETSPSVINEVARQIKEASGEIDFKALGNQQYGWKGVAFKVPATQTAEQTAALLESLLALPEVESAEANIFVTAVRPLLAASNKDEDAFGAAASKPGSTRGGGKIRPSPSPQPPTTPSPSPNVPTTPSPSPPPPASPSPAPCGAFTPGPITTQANPPSWGLDRIDQAQGQAGSYQYSSTAATGVNVFVVDTGIQADHPQLIGRVGLVGAGGYDAFGGTGADGNNHGTHCAGTIGGTIVGVAKGVRLYAVRVLDNAGSGTSTTVVNGINFVANSPLTNKIISMSLGGGFSSAINNAVQGASNAGVLSIVAAGNDNADACNSSPASAPSAITVGASDSADNAASFSNWGSCVDIWAPGVSIYSSITGSSYARFSGTSMATPHVAGVAARLWSAGVCNSAQSCAASLKCMATANVVAGLSGAKAASPNLMLYVPPGV